MSEKQEKPIVNHRWQLPSLPEILDYMLPRWSDGDHPDFSTPDGYERLRGAFERFGKHLLSRAGWSLEKAAGKGIDQAIRLICDPEYHQTVKRRTKRAIEAEQKERARQDAERERWRRCEFTFDEKVREIARLDQTLKYHEKEIAKVLERKAKVQGVVPSSFETELVNDYKKPEFAPENEKDGGDDEWPDRISFD